MTQILHIQKKSYLGLVALCNLSGSSHIEEIVLKTNRKLGLILKICTGKFDIDSRKLLYCSLVRPKLEYTCELMSPLTSRHKLLIENVQRRATRFILGYPTGKSYTKKDY